MKIDHKKVEKLKSFNGVKLRGNETFNELLAIEKKNMLKGTIICKAKKCDNAIKTSVTLINPQYCLECI